jgi:hypothetical protein
VRSLANVYSTALLSDAEINTSLNEANQEVASMMHWPYLTVAVSLTTTPGTDVCPIPGDAAEVLQVSVRSGSRRTLTPTTVFDADADTGDAYSSLPLFYRHDPLNGIVLFPTPGSSEELTVVYRRVASTLSTDASTPEMQAEFHPMLAYKAAAQLLSDKRGDPKKIEVLAQSFANYVERMRKHYMISSDHSPVRPAGRRPRWVRWLG